MNATSPTLNQIWSWLDEVVDPEIPVISVVDLGIVRGLSWGEVQGEPKLTISITPTYSGCPAIAAIKKDIVTALNERGISNVQVETRLAPAWTTDWLSEKGKRCLREYGIAPPVGTQSRLGKACVAAGSAGFPNSDGRAGQSAATAARASDSAAPEGPPYQILRSHCSVNHAEDESIESVECPRCGSKNTRVVSQFGSTPCKAFYVCATCREPFDYFKCH
jgi:ring-1,2-phenylacetyl-CoA epoxidase subunit PaaD